MVFSGYSPVVGLLDHMVVLFLVFKQTPYCSLYVAVSVYIPSGVRGFPFLHISANLLVVDFLMMAFLTGVR